MWTRYNYNSENTMTMNKTRGKWTVFLLNAEMWLRNSEWCVSSVICIIPSVLTAVSRLAGCGRSDDVFLSLLGACGVVQMMPTSGEAGMIHHIGHATTCIYINNNQIIKHATDIRTPTTREIIEKRWHFLFLERGIWYEI